MKKIVFVLLAIAFVILLSDDLTAQCAMCKMNAENAAENKDAGIGEGINAGIVYLMGIPYLLLASGAFVFFRHKLFKR
jgi:hypothetical protein